MFLNRRRQTPVILLSPAFETYVSKFPTRTIRAKHKTKNESFKVTERRADYNKEVERKLYIFICLSRPRSSNQSLFWQDWHCLRKWLPNANVDFHSLHVKTRICYKLNKPLEGREGEQKRDCRRERSGLKVVTLLQMCPQWLCHTHAHKYTLKMHANTHTQGTHCDLDN